MALKNWMYKHPVLTRVLDPAGVFHEGGWFGWDLFNFDTTSEDAMAQYALYIADLENDVDNSKDQSIKDIGLNTSIVIGVMLFYFFLIYSFSKGWLKP